MLLTSPIWDIPPLVRFGTTCLRWNFSLAITSDKFTMKLMPGWDQILRCEELQDLKRPFDITLIDWKIPDLNPKLLELAVVWSQSVTYYFIFQLLPMEAMIGLGVGAGVFLIIIIVVLIVFCCCKKKDKVSFIRVDGQNSATTNVWFFFVFCFWSFYNSHSFFA